jgi:hypothetical protein
VGSVNGLRILEVGSGTGYLLSRLARYGASCVGVEPGDHAQERFSGAGVELVQDFFPTEEVSGRFDLIILHNVLEHIEDTLTFLSQINGSLAIGGTLLVSVPACDSFIDSGDISMFVHEHFSYFTRASLQKLLLVSGFSDVQLEASGLGRSWHVAAHAPQSQTSRIVTETEPIASGAGFLARSSRAVDRLAELLLETFTSGQSLGVYVPLRALNALFISGAHTDHVRFFDDDPDLEGSYLPGFDIKIENRVSLDQNPTDCVLIMSAAFGTQIQKGLSEILPPRTRTILFEDLIRHLPTES